MVSMPRCICHLVCPLNGPVFVVNFNKAELPTLHVEHKPKMKIWKIFTLVSKGTIGAPSRKKIQLKRSECAVLFLCAVVALPFNEEIKLFTDKNIFIFPTSAG